MQKYLRTSLLAAVLVCGSVLAQAPGPHGMSGSGQGPHNMQQQMMGGLESMQAMKTTGDIDKDFAMMMRVHHQQAVDMAKLEQERGKSAELKKMAKKIIKDQQREIAQFDKWLEKNK